MLRKQLCCLLIMSAGYCNGQQSTEGDFPKTVSIEKYKATISVPEISYAATTGKNVIYTPTFLFAWDEVKDALGRTITVMPKKGRITDVHNLETINTASSFHGSLSKGEYTTKVKIAMDTLDVTAFFKKILPFAQKMQTYKQPFYFNNVNVHAFGMARYTDAIAAQVKVLYYKNNDSFIIKLSPKDTKQEIILVMGFNGSGNYTLNDINNLVKTYTDLGSKEGALAGNEWKYRFNEGESVVIPVLRFNIEANYKDLLDLDVKAHNDIWTIMTATQRTAFVLNEEGAKAEAEAHVVLVSKSGPPPHLTAAHQKKLYFNKPFTVLLRKTGQAHPYFMAKIENAELMVPAKGN